MYRVVYKFRDLKDGLHTYKVGDTYPRKGVIEDEKRIEELLSKTNKLRRPLIEKIEEEKPIEEKKIEEEAKPKKKRKSSKKKSKE